MPAKAPPRGPKLEKILLQLGQQIRGRRKGIKVSATATAEAAGVSRMTLNRIEHGEASVTMGAYINVMSVLGLTLKPVDANLSKKIETFTGLKSDAKIPLADYPQLKKLAWQLKKTKVLNPKEALSLYERNWRHINLSEITTKERELIQNLMTLMGTERLLV